MAIDDSFSHNDFDWLLFFTKLSKANNFLQNNLYRTHVPNWGIFFTLNFQLKGPASNKIRHINSTVPFSRISIFENKIAEVIPVSKSTNIQPSTSTEERQERGNQS